MYGSMCNLTCEVLDSVIVFRLRAGSQPCSTETDDNAVDEMLLAIISQVLITALNYVYQRMAVKLSDWENHRTTSSYQNSLILKTFAFQFVNSFMALFYAAFAERDMEKLSLSLLGIMTAKLIVDKFKEFVWTSYRVNKK